MSTVDMAASAWHSFRSDEAKPAFDCPHPGPERADFFAAIGADELARAVPRLRKQLIR